MLCHILIEHCMPIPIPRTMNIPFKAKGMQ